MRHLDFVNMKMLERVPVIKDERFIDTKLVPRKLPYHHLPGNYHLFLLNDTHTGNAASSEQYMYRVNREVRKHKHSYVIWQGDQFECIDITDKRFSLEVHGNRSSRLEAQRNHFVQLFDPIADRVLVMLDGNHEYRLRNLYLINKDVAEGWGTVYANGTAAKCLFPGWRLMCVHGTGTIRSRAGDRHQRHHNNLVMLKRKLRNLPADDCDIITCGHYHQLWVHPPEQTLIGVSDYDCKLHHKYTEPGRIDMGDGFYRIPEDDRWYMCCGSFLRGYMEDMPTYTEDKQYELNELGYGVIEVKNDRPVNVEVVALRE